MQPPDRRQRTWCVRRSSAVIVPFQAPKTSTPSITTGDDSTGEPTGVVPEQPPVGAAQHPDVAVHAVHDELVAPDGGRRRHLPVRRVVLPDHLAVAHVERAHRSPRVRDVRHAVLTRPPGTRSACRARATRRPGTAGARGGPAAPACGGRRRRTSSTAASGGRSGSSTSGACRTRGAPRARRSRS